MARRIHTESTGRDTLDDQAIPLSLAQRDELDCRLADIEEDRGNLITWDAMKAELERRCP